MSELNPDKEFKPILEKIENEEIRTTHQLRLILDGLAEKYNIKALKVLEMLREWLLSNGIALSTDDGMVSIDWLEE